MSNPNPHKLPPRWKKGESGNPSGSAKKDPREVAAVKQIKESLWLVAVCTRERLAKLWPDPTYAQKLAISLFIRAADHKSVPAIREAYDRLLGKAPQALTGEDGSPLIPEGQSNPLAPIPVTVLERLLDVLEDQEKKEPEA